MILYLLVIAAGLVFLVWSADRFVLGASATARNLGVSPLIIGLTIVGIGTSAPEILVSGIASWGNNPGLAVGNAVGSNIANIALVIGCTALVSPIAVSSATLQREYPLMLGIIVLAGVLMLDQDLDRFDGAVLLATLVIVMVIMVRIGIKARRADPLRDEFEHEIPATMATGRAVARLLIGLVVLLASSRLVVWGAVNVAQVLEVSDLLIGLTIVAVGTSLPELAASLMSVIKKEPDIAIGNVIGSNMFNLLPVLALPGLLAPGPLQPEVLQRDFPVMGILSIALFAMAYGFRGPGRVTRWEGGALVIVFCAYQTLLYFSFA